MPMQARLVMDRHGTHLYEIHAWYARGTIGTHRRSTPLSRAQRRFEYRHRALAPRAQGASGARQSPHPPPSSTPSSILCDSQPYVLQDPAAVDQGLFLEFFAGCSWQLLVAHLVAGRVGVTMDVAEDIVERPRGGPCLQVSHLRSLLGCTGPRTRTGLYLE
jgi:hypothetical protein